MAPEGKTNGNKQRFHAQEHTPVDFANLFFDGQSADCSQIIYIYIYISIYNWGAISRPQGCTLRSPAVGSRCKNVSQSALNVLAFPLSFSIVVKIVAWRHGARISASTATQK